MQSYATSLLEYERMQKNDVKELEEWTKKFREELIEHYKQPKELNITVEEIENRIKALQAEYIRAKYWITAQNLLLILLYRWHPVRNVYREMKKIR